MPLVRRVLFTLLCLGWTGCVEPARKADAPVVEPKPGNFPKETVKIANVERVYRLVVPKTVDLAKPCPLVVAFHGMLIDSKDVMPEYTKLNETAEKHKFIIAYPNAIGGMWGVMPDKVTADLKLFDALLAEVEGKYRIDEKRIYVLGMSNGGYFAHLVATERSKKVAAVAAHSTMLGLQTAFGIKAERKFPVMIIHGDKDSIFPIAVARADRAKYEKEGHEVKYVEVPGLNHFWAAKKDINETIWKFFEDHPRAK